MDKRKGIRSIYLAIGENGSLIQVIPLAETFVSAKQGYAISENNITVAITGVRANRCIDHEMQCLVERPCGWIIKRYTP